MGDGMAPFSSMLCGSPSLSPDQSALKAVVYPRMLDRSRLQFFSTEKKQRDTSAPRSQGRTREAKSDDTLAKNAQHQSSMCVFVF